MPFVSRRHVDSTEWIFVVLMLVAAAVATFAMIHVVADFGFTALGAPIVTDSNGP